MPSRNDDPPDYPEAPECCGKEMECDGVMLRCTGACNRTEALDPDWDPAPEPEELPDNGCLACGKPTDCIYCSDECAPNCVHGNRPGDCDNCDHASDVAYDAARESR